MRNRRIVVTGIGVVTPIGSALPEFWDNLVAGKSGVGTVTRFDVSAYDTKIAGEVKNFEPAVHFKNPKDARRTDRFAQLAMAAAKTACRDAGLPDAAPNLERVGVLVGSGIGGLKVLEDQHAILLSKGPTRVSPFMIPMMISDISAGIIAMEYGFKGPNFGITSACATASHSIGEGWRMIRDDDADFVIVGGSEAAVVPLGLSGFGAMKAISTRNDAPEKASRPFDLGRDGFVLGEGAGVLVLEEYESAKNRGANIYGEMIGYGATADAHHLTSPPPEGEGAARAMKLALKHAGVNAEEVDYINAHGTSTPLGDIAETKAIKTIFGAHAKKLWVSSTKSMTGHLLGAAGAVEMAACLKTLQTGIVHPTINLEQPDPECDLDYVPNVARERAVRTVMSNSFGFGGHNACLIARKVA
ncbi:MAG: beta-ketoacyl-ACP synthase II [bacterium]